MRRGDWGTGFIYFDAYRVLIESVFVNTKGSISIFSRHHQCIPEMVEEECAAGEETAAAPAPAPAASKGSSPARPPTGSGAAAKSGAKKSKPAGQRNIMSFFGAK